MALLPCLFFFLLFEISLSKQVLPLTPLISLKCNPSPSSQNSTHKMQTLLHNLTLGGAPPTSLLTTLNFTFGPDNYSGLMQCRPGLGPDQCSRCATAAHTSITAHCPNSDAVSAWFDGCYIQISSKNPPRYPSISGHSCSARATNPRPNPTQFVPALETLLLQLRAAVKIPTRRGFSQGQILYGDRNQTLCGLVECVGSISMRECDYCVKSAIEKVQIHCGSGDHGGGTVIDGACLVRFDTTNETICNVNLGDSAGDTVGASDFIAAESDGGKHWCRKEAVVAYWGGGVACFAAVVLLVGLVRRAVLNTAKVGGVGIW